MRRGVERLMEVPLAEEMSGGKLVEGQPIQVSADEDKLTFTQKSAAETAVAGD